MSNTVDWRIETLLIDRSQTVSPVVGSTGATVIRAGRGPVKPIKFPRGSKNKILQVYGDYSTTYPDIWDAVEFNKKSELWISAPYASDGLFGGVLVTQNGTEALTSGLSNISTIDWSAITWTETLGTGNGTTTNFTLTVNDFSHYTNQTIDILVDGTSINVTASDAATEVLTTTPDVGDGTFIRATGVLDFTFDTAPTSGQAITVEYTVDRSSDVYFGLFNVAPQTDNKATLITYSGGIFTTNLYEIENGTNYAIQGSPYEISLTEGAKNGFGKVIYIENVLDNSSLFAYNVNTDLAVTTFVDDTSAVNFSGGSRGTAITLTELTTGWDYFQSANTYAADIFFDSTADAGIPAIFEALVNSDTGYQRRSSAILPLPQDTVANSITTKAGYSISNRNIAFYWNYGLILNDLGGTNFYSPLTGRVAGKYADMSNIYNGLAPAGIDENGHGGQIGGNILEMLYDVTGSGFKSGDLYDLDSAGINGIAFDNVYGVMIASQRTSLTTLSDYAYVAHSRLANYILRNIETQVLPYQVVKLNDAVHRAQVKAKAEAIINPLLGDTVNLLRDAIVLCSEVNNTDEVLALREFHLYIAVKFTTFSEYIKLIFINTETSANVQETFG